MENFYVLLGILTVIHYALLRKLLKKKDNELSMKDYVIYLSILPILAYLFYYLFQNKSSPEITISRTPSIASTGIMSMPYPDSVSLSLSSTSSN